MFEDTKNESYDLNITACRICLIMDVKLHSIINTEYEDIYLVLTGIVPHKIDRGPRFLCTECKHRLQQYYKFRNKCLRSDNILTQMMFTGAEFETISILDRSALQLESDLCISPINIVTITDAANTFFEREDIKKELTEEDSFDCKDFDVTNFDSEDDVPLTTIKGSSQEGEIPQKVKVNKRVPRKTSRETTNRGIKKGFQEDYAEEITLSKEEQLEELNKRADSINYIHSPFKCTLCFKGFIDSVAYSNHKLKHDESSGAYECDICHCRYLNRRQLTSHIATSHSKRYMCKTCDHRSHTANQARDHEKWHRGFVYECKLCGWKFKKPTTHLTHMRKRHPTEWTCTVCGGSFIGRHGLLMHQSKMHKTHNFSLKQEPRDAATCTPERYCGECGVLFVSAEAKQRHMVVSLRHSMHSKNSDTCIACGETFSSKTELTRHMRNHIRLSDPDESQAPVRRTIVKKVTCDTCGAKFETRSKLQVHIKRIHLGLKYNKNVVCEVCGRRCTSNAALKYHQRTHTGERPFACTSCPKRFSDKNQLRIHGRTHTNERPYSCALCGKTFRQKPSLNRHTRVHTGAKPYECQYCAKTFSQSNSMKLHVKTIHLKMPGKRSKNKVLQDTEEAKPDVQSVLTAQHL